MCVFCVFRGGSVCVQVTVKVRRVRVWNDSPISHIGVYDVYLLYKATLAENFSSELHTFSRWHLFIQNLRNNIYRNVVITL